MQICCQASFFFLFVLESVVLFSTSLIRPSTRVISSSCNEKEQRYNKTHGHTTIKCICIPNNLIGNYERMHRNIPFLHQPSFGIYFSCASQHSQLDTLTHYSRFPSYVRGCDLCVVIKQTRTIQ